MNSRTVIHTSYMPLCVPLEKGVLVVSLGFIWLCHQNVLQICLLYVGVFVLHIVCRIGCMLLHRSDLSFCRRPSSWLGGSARLCCSVGFLFCSVGDSIYSRFCCNTSSLCVLYSHCGCKWVLGSVWIYLGGMCCCLLSALPCWLVGCFWL